MASGRLCLLPLGGGGAVGAARALAAGGPPHVLRRQRGRHLGA